MRKRRGRTRRVVGIASGVVVLTLVGGGVALALASDGGEQYRTAVAGPGSVAQSVSAVGTVASASRRDVAFQVSGTVASVGVGVGDTVAAGDTLATLDDTDLQSEVGSAASDLADAEQQLEDDLDSQTSSSTSSTSTTSATTASAAGTGTAAFVVQTAAYATGTTTTAEPAAAPTAAPGPQPTAAPTTEPTAAPTDGPTDPPADDDVPQAVLDAESAVDQAQQDLLDQYDATSQLLTDSGADVSAAQLVCQEFLDADLGSGTPSVGDVLTLTPGSVAAGAALRVDAAGVAALGDGEAYTLRLASSGAVVGTVTATDGDAFHVAVLVPSGASGDDAIELVGPDGSTVSSTSMTVTAADESSLPAALAACQDAISGVLGGQSGVDEAQQQLMTLAAALDDAVDALEQAWRDAWADGSTPTPDPEPTQPGDPGTEDPGTGDPGTGSPGTGDGGSGGTGGTGGTGGEQESAVASAADVLADRAAIDLAQARLDLANAQLTFVTLTAPIGGTVAAVSIVAGEDVGAASDSTVVTIIGGDGYVVTSSATLAQVGLLAVGQSADVTVRTTDAPLTATISSVGVLNTETSSTTPSYTIDLVVDPTDETLYDGSSAQLTIAVADGDEVLTVPTSAVHVESGTTTVQVLRDGAPAQVEVTTGAVGAELTEITDGLSAGDEVVLADLEQQLVSDDSSSSGLSGLGDTDDQQQTGPGGNFGGGFGGGPPAGFQPPNG
ncbi:HlyD family efflux transporter periplasmic adaptor subunit [Cellulomonas composti]|uniref:HlyD family efflux transporter periplasmic adaptor subunit n=1 Tax=Cellulomonas composti TaxID=266130 RepID=UPI001649A01F|nr:HlyD family efflux transporter periplasmic adaptor subunit [Cellulomonas composti]